MIRKLGILFILLGLGLGFFTVGRAMYLSNPPENLEDPSVVPANFQATSSPVPANIQATSSPVPANFQTTSSPANSSAGLKAPLTLPVRLAIPKIGVNAAIQRVGLTTKGNMANPSNFTDVAWYKYGPKPGELGSAVMAGHLDNALAINGVFKKLNELEVGDDVYVTAEDGTKLKFRVTDTQVYPYNNGPLEKIFNAKDAKRLNLITCAGIWLKAEKTYSERLVVYTELVE